jgi:predicted nucleic acid-binding protein
LTLADRILVDASVAIKWVVDEPGSAEAVLLLDRRLLAPDLLCAEFADILRKMAIRREITSEEADIAAQALESADVEFVAMRPYLAAATALAIALDHPAYDCIYLAIAADLAIPLVTADERLAKKLRQNPSGLRCPVVALTEVSSLL